MPRLLKGPAMRLFAGGTKCTMVRRLLGWHAVRRRLRAVSRHSAHRRCPRVANDGRPERRQAASGAREKSDGDAAEQPDSRPREAEPKAESRWRRHEAQAGDWEIQDGERRSTQLCEDRGHVRTTRWQGKAGEDQRQPRSAPGEQNESERPATWPRQHHRESICNRDERDDHARDCEAFANAVSRHAAQRSGLHRPATAPAGPDPATRVCRQVAAKANATELLTVRVQRLLGDWSTTARRATEWRVSLRS